MKNPYLVYLIRLWPIQSGDDQIWRISLEDAQTGQRHGFATLDDLTVYLREVTDEMKGDGVNVKCRDDQDE